MPIDSIIGTFEPGGGDEFAAGFHEFFNPLAVVTTSFFYDAIGFNGGKEQSQSIAVYEVQGEGNEASGTMTLAAPVKN